MSLQRHCKSWTAIEDAVVRQLCHAFSDRQIADLLGRAETAVSNRWKTTLQGDIIEKYNKIEAKYVSQLNSGEAIEFTDVSHAQYEFKFKRIQIKVNDKTITETLKFNHRSDAIKYALVMAQEWEDMCDVDGDQSAPSSPEPILTNATTSSSTSHSTPSTPSQKRWSDEDIANAVGYYIADIPIEEIADGLGKDIDDTEQKIKSILEPQTNDNHNRSNSNTTNTNNKVKQAIVALPRRPTDQHAPKRPINSFFVFAHKIRPTLTVKGRGAVQKMVALKWNELSDREKAPHQEEAKCLQKDYKIKMEAYAKSSHAKRFQAKLREWKAECDRKKGAAMARGETDASDSDVPLVISNHGKPWKDIDVTAAVVWEADGNSVQWIAEQLKRTESDVRTKLMSLKLSGNSVTHKNKRPHPDDNLNFGQPRPKRIKVDKSKMTANEVADWICLLGPSYTQYKNAWIQDGINGVLMETLDKDKHLLNGLVTKIIHAKKIRLEWLKFNGSV